MSTLTWNEYFAPITDAVQYMHDGGIVLPVLMLVVGFIGRWIIVSNNWE